MNRTALRLSALAVGLLCQSFAGGAQAQEAAAPHAFRLPASYIGILPCADCAGISTTLGMAPDSVYLLRRVYVRDAAASKDTVTTYGRWRVSDTGKVLYLYRGQELEMQFAIGAEETVRLLDRQGQAITSEVNHDLKRALGLSPIPEWLDFVGYYRGVGEEGHLLDCRAARDMRVVGGANKAALEAAYIDARDFPGQPVLVTFRGSLTWRQKEEGRGSERVLLVETFDRFWPGLRCEDK